MAEEAAALAYRPLISIVTPVYNTPEVWLRAAIVSVRSQVYTEWQLCLANDASPEPHVQRVLEEYAAKDERIRVVQLAKNSGISGASNAALALAEGEFVGLLDHDDELLPNSLLEVVKRLNAEPDLDLVYTDEDKKAPDGKRFAPFFKPDWSPHLLLSCNYIAHFSVYRRSLLEGIGGFRSEFDGSQDYDLVLRFTERTKRIAHIPQQLYSWRSIPGSAAASVKAKPYAYTAAVGALTEALGRRGIEGRVEPTETPGQYDLHLAPPAGAVVSIIIPTRSKDTLLRRCLRSIEAHRPGVQYEVIVVDSAPEEPLPPDLAEVVSALVPFDRDLFNFSRAINLGAAKVQGEYLLLLNDDTRVLSGGWIEAMLAHAQRPEVGVVGARLLDRKGEPVHEGVALGVWGRPGANVVVPWWGLGECLRDVSAVTAACVMTRRDVFEELGGLDEGLRMAWNDVDYCLRARQAGYTVLYTPLAELRHDEGSTRGTKRHADDDAAFRERWGDPMALADPYYNPNFDRALGPFVLGQ
jgi:GT2 family glycosyltransferase